MQVWVCRMKKIVYILNNERPKYLSKRYNSNTYEHIFSIFMYYIQYSFGFVYGFFAIVFDARVIKLIHTLFFFFYLFKHLSFFIVFSRRIVTTNAHGVVMYNGARSCIKYSIDDS